ncbi:3-hydroxyisobutyryl-CoA hydrolase 1-like [Impatiens glandulifera]|uniref:3-hydroxyisobutyryl-CoA hydrolase 1-like n=1 Tax=Impatiens glandulifera TaxID=253017 RepID=UPI001FB0896C|nr:3-hydroxyisobutyryl-CoA hydrolase 1-like [Impatiens glandulifera]
MQKDMLDARFTLKEVEKTIKAKTKGTDSSLSLSPSQALPSSSIVSIFDSNRLQIRNLQALSDLVFLSYWKFYVNYFYAPVITTMKKIYIKEVLQLLKNLTAYEKDPNVNLVMIKGNGKAFSAGGDLISLLQFGSAGYGHWSFQAKYYYKLLTLLHLNATYKKPLITIVNGFVMGGGAGLSTFATFRIITENTIFSMPEVKMGLTPNSGAGYFFSRLPGYFGEYMGLTGARIDGAEMIACGLATHFVPSKDLVLLKSDLEEIAGLSMIMDISKVNDTINKYAITPSLKQDSSLKKLKMINECFSKATVENILSSLVDLSIKNEDKLIIHSIRSMKDGSPSNLKIFLKLIREGRMQKLEKCFVRDYNINVNIFSAKFSSDIIEGTRAMLIEKDNKPRWNPSCLEEVKEEFVNKHFEEIDDDEFQPLVLDASRTLNHRLISMMRPNL